jgi:hypothetical protein
MFSLVRILCLFLAVASMVAGTAGVAGASIESQMTWVPAVPVDLLPAPARGIALNRISCATPSLCVAVDSAGNVVTATDPTGRTSAWTLASVDSQNNIRDVSCVAPSLCVAVDEMGNILSSTNPTGGANAWTVTSIDRNGRGITGVSCASPSLCVAVDDAGNVLSSTNPTGGAGAWSTSPVDLNSLGYKGAYPIMAVSCTSAPWCVAVDGFGEVLMSSNPTDGASAWSILDVGGGAFYGVSCVMSSICAASNWTGDIFTLSSPGAPAGWQAVQADPPIGVVSPDIHVGDVSCPSASLCVAGDQNGNVITSANPTAGPTSWTVTNIDGPTLITGVSCPTASLCVAVDQPGRVLVGIQNQTLSVTTRGSGTGQVIGSSITCPSTCSHAYPTGSTVTLSAHPSPGSSFQGWSGACSGSGACELTLTAAQTVTATFNRSTVSLNTRPTTIPALIKRGLHVRIRCTQACTAHIDLRIDTKPVQGPTPRTNSHQPPHGAIGHTTIKLTAGPSRAVTIQLSANAKRWLAYTRHATLELAATATSHQGTTITTSSVTVSR